MAASLIMAVQIYAGIGALVAMAFLTFGIDRIDENARGAVIFRPILVPGILIVWPLVLIRWRQLERDSSDPLARHHPPLALQPWMALCLALLIPTLISMALVIRQDGPVEARAQLLEPAQ